MAYSAEYAPSDEVVRHVYALGPNDQISQRREAEFDRFIAKVRADAWDEGWKHAGKVFRAAGTGPRTRNPYRT